MSQLLNITAAFKTITDQQRKIEEGNHFSHYTLFYILVKI